MDSPDNVPHKGEQRPRFFASIEDPETASSVKNAAPARDFLSARENKDAYEEPTEEDLANFRAQMEALALTDRERKERDKLRREAQRHILQKAKVREILRTQRYLGLRKRNGNDGNAAHGEQAAPSQIDDSGSELDLQQVTSHPQESSVVFICVDIEAYEFPPNPITEVGIATLDTADIAGLAPGTNGRNWFKKIRARHFLIEECRYMENRVHCKGNRDGFVFG